jgi:hypothetical protein
MKRSIKAALGIVLVALAVPTAALATHNNGHDFGHHHRQFQTGATGSTGSGTSVSSFDQTTGALVLTLGNGGTVSGTVNYATHIVCLGDWRHFFFPRGHWRFARSHRHTTKLTRGYFRHGDQGSTGDTGSTGSTGQTGSTGATGSTGGQGSDHGHGHHSYGNGGYGNGGYGNGGYDRRHHHDYRPTPRHERCDGSLLVAGVSIERADVAINSQGAFFTDVVLLPAVQ